MNKKMATPKSKAASNVKFNNKDMSTAAQRARVLEYLRAGSQTTYSLRRHGISHPAQRVRELILIGHVISSSPVTAIDSDGFAHRKVALYTLVKEVRISTEEEAA
ncbi:helix-turn-helix domain-containing protein [Burkholderia sp. FERM BP-3421]|uniref:helix-turn-helix domain-containing protein n=1 Tax=Burkholderia sp. FERM BP-3421 TaxID=1494466 RepID=UPI0023608001|nr:helix-turn-helix domain-containing protein [Burkholderia sp. FERM BP-3421]WDD95747.1 helix-turn-helix domain-containing protein [Burkholderia sp. FERM BP-3421]